MQSKVELEARFPCVIFLGDANIGNGVTLGNEVTLGDWVTLGDEVKLGNWVTLGNGVTLGNRVTLARTPVQVQCFPYVVYPHSPTQIGVGCIVHDLAYWMRENDPDELADHPECQPWSRYRAAIALVASRISDLAIAGKG